MNDVENRPIPCVGVIITNESGEVLLGKRKGAHGAGEWGLPGGKMDFGESVKEAALREVKEETGLTVTFEQIAGINDDFEWIDDGRQYLTMIINVSSTGKTPEICEPHKCEQWRWFTHDDLPENMFSPTKRALELAQSQDMYRPRLSTH